MHPVVRLVAQRIALGLLLLIAASVLIFVGTNILPGDVAQAILGQQATPTALANLRAQMGLDQPYYIRYLHWLFAAMHGDLGKSLANGQDIATEIQGRLANTLFLAGVSAAIIAPMSIILGLISALYEGRWPDKVLSGITLAWVSLPEFLLGYILIYFLAVEYPIAPSVSTVYDSMGFWAKLHAIILPVMVLVMVSVGHTMRMTRAAILNVMQSAYIETAELKGLRPFRVILMHAFPNAISPIVNVLMVDLAYLVVGVVVTEVVFVYPGMGQYLVDHVAKRDVPVVQAVGLIFAAVYIGLNMVADVVSILANPRLRHPK
ncbi:ABC transporter permease [Solirhodobacter olei]|uniref:ABC transporter permease n=1 Tax=Solirhodobacter olei TaxID=2493082 RepID=UPI000FDAED5D|nr:ABC transporter permease [Solirhodobacter olei]